MKERIIEIGRDSIWYFGVNLISVLIGFIAIPIFTRIFVPSEYGIYSLVNTAISLGAPIIFVYLQGSVIRFYPEYDNEGRLDVFYSTALHYLPHFMVFFLAVLLPIALFVIPLGEYRLLVCLSISIFALFTVYNVFLGLLRVRQMTRQYACIYVFVQFCNYIVGAGLAVWLKAGVAGPFLGWLGALIVAVPLQFAVLRISRQLKWKKNSRLLQREFFRFGFPLIFTTLLAEVLTAADRYMVLAFKGAYQVGLYTVVYTLVMSIERLMVSFISLGAIPVIYKVYETEGDEKTIELVRQITRYFLIIMVPVVVGTFVLRVPIIHVLTSPKYYGSSSIMLPLALGIFLNNLAWLPHIAFRLKKKTRIALVPMAVAAASNIAMNAVLIPRYGYSGAAWATLASYLLYFVLLTGIGRGYMRWSFPWNGTLRVLAASGIMGAGLLGLERVGLGGFAGLLALVAAGALIYFAALVLLGGVTQAEMAFAAGALARVPVVGRLFSKWKREDAD